MHLNKNPRKLHPIRSENKQQQQQNAVGRALPLCANVIFANKINSRKQTEHFRDEPREIKKSGMRN